MVVPRNYDVVQNNKILLCLFIYSHQMNRLVVQLRFASAAQEEEMNTKLAIPAGLIECKNYHVTVVIIDRVPAEQTEESKKQILKWLNEIRTLKESPLSFDVTECTTFPALKHPVYKTNCPILLPGDMESFRVLNANLIERVTNEMKEVEIDSATTVANYVPHITLSTPKVKGKILDSVASKAVQVINNIISRSALQVKLNSYRISVQQSE